MDTVEERTSDEEWGHWLRWMFRLAFENDDRVPFCFVGGGGLMVTVEAGELLA